MGELPESYWRSNLFWLCVIRSDAWRRIRGGDGGGMPEDNGMPCYFFGDVWSVVLVCVVYITMGWCWFTLLM